MPAEPPVVKPSIDARIGRLLASALSHGTRTPLHALRGLLELLAAQDLDEGALKLLHDAQNCGAELLAANNRLLLLIEVLSAETSVFPRRFSVQQLLAEVKAAAPGHCETVCRITGTVPDALWGDADSLRQLLIELVGNAVSCGSRRLEIGVGLLDAVTADTATVRCTIRDLDAGTRGSAGTDGPAGSDGTAGTDGPTGTDGPAGTSGSCAVGGPAEGDPVPCWDVNPLDRLMVRGLVTRLGGTIAAKRGTGAVPTVVVDLSLGLRRLEPAAPERGDGQARPTGPDGLRVLLVEDNPVNLILAQRQMRQLGHHLDTVHSGFAAVHAVLDGEHDYDVILLDRHLPDIDGIEVTQQIRAAEAAADRDRSRRIPIIAVTADVSHGHRERCLAAGMDGFLTKPLSLERLRSALTAIATVPGPLSSAPAEPDFDAEALRRLSEDLDCDANTIAEVMRTYLEELPRRKKRVQWALRRGSFRQTMAAAECLRASSETVGAVKLAAVCAELQHAVEGGDLRRCQALLPALHNACQSVTTTLGLAEAALRGVPTS